MEQHSSVSFMQINKDPQKNMHIPVKARRKVKPGKISQREQFQVPYVLNEWLET